jgi:hypothetical protein
MVAKESSCEQVATPMTPMGKAEGRKRERESCSNGGGWDGKETCRWPVDSGLGMNRAIHQCQNLLLLLCHGANVMLDISHAPRSSRLSTGMSPSRMVSTVLMSAAHPSKVSLDIFPTGMSSMRSCAKDANAGRSI